MSLFLGYIHHLMFDKILFQEDLLESLLELLKDDEKIKLRDELNNDFPIEKGDLKDIIDESNIHGWLDERVRRSENRLAKTVGVLLKDFDVEDLKNKFYDFGKSYEAGESPEEAFKFITSKFLDGMPCDHSLMIVKNDEDEFVFKIARDLHREIWETYVNPDLYWDLRDAFISGSLENSGLKYEKINDDYVIRKWFNGYFKKYNWLFGSWTWRNSCLLRQDGRKMFGNSWRWGWPRLFQEGYKFYKIICRWTSPQERRGHFI